MAQGDSSIIARAFTDLGAQIPLISNHPTVQMLDRVHNLQEEVRGQFRRQDEQDYHTCYYWYWWTYQKYRQVLIPLSLRI